MISPIDSYFWSLPGYNTTVAVAVEDKYPRQGRDEHSGCSGHGRTYNFSQTLIRSRDRNAQNAARSVRVYGLTCKYVLPPALPDSYCWSLSGNETICTPSQQTVTACDSLGTLPLLQWESVIITTDCHCWSLPGYATTLTVGVYDYQL